MEIKKEDLDAFLKEQMDNIFACAVLTKDGISITKFGENYYIETSPDSAKKVLQAITDINSKDL